jgi:hypothetical protein
MAFDLFTKKSDDKNFGRQFFVIGQDVREIVTPEQTKMAREWFYKATISIGLGVVSGLVTHTILKHERAKSR